MPVAHASAARVVDQLLWITPAAGGPQRSFARVARALGDAANVRLLGLQVWQRPSGSPYDLDVEVKAVIHDAELGGLPAYHLFGFSAGATVALAVARRVGKVARSLTVFEPASIGDDDWSPIEATWRSELNAIRTLEPASARSAAFAALMLPPGATAPRRDVPPPQWNARADQLEDMLAHVGFSSSDLAEITAPVMVLTGGRSHPRFARLADRLVEVVPGAAQVGFPARSHLSPPMREEPDEVARLLRRLWSHDH